MMRLLNSTLDPRPSIPPVALQTLNFPFPSINSLAFPFHLRQVQGSTCCIHFPSITLPSSSSPWPKYYEGLSTASCNLLNLPSSRPSAPPLTLVAVITSASEPHLYAFPFPLKAATRYTIIMMMLMMIASPEVEEMVQDQQDRPATFNDFIVFLYLFLLLLLSQSLPFIHFAPPLSLTSSLPHLIIYTPILLVIDTLYCKRNAAPHFSFSSWMPENTSEVVDIPSCHVKWGKLFVLPH